MKTAGFVLVARTTGRVLLLKVPRGPWDTPGGHLEPGESVLTAACRELHEETGFRGDLEILQRVRTTKKHTTFVALVDREFRAVLTEHEDYGWFRTPPRALTKRTGLR